MILRHALFLRLVSFFCYAFMLLDFWVKARVGLVWSMQRVTGKDWGLIEVFIGMNDSNKKLQCLVVSIQLSIFIPFMFTCILKDWF